MAAVKKPGEILKDASENVSTNPTNNRSFREVAEAHLSRRTVVQGSLAAAAAGFLVPRAGHAWGRGHRPRKNGSLIDFEPLAIEDVVAAGGKTVTISPDFEYQVLIPWGTPINPAHGVKPYEGDPNTRPTPEEQEQLIGIGHDGMWLFPANLPRVLRIEARRGRELPAKARRRVLSNRAGMLCINHEYGENIHVFGKDFPTTLTDVRLSQAAHGVSVVAIAKRGWWGQWDVVPDDNSRRITVNSDVEFSGPAASSPLLVNSAGNSPKGTANNCGSGPTPWGTYVTCEENFNGYFGSTQTDGSFGGFDALQDQAFERYGFGAGGFGYGWHLFDERFDLSNPAYANESNRFGWCVEIDPFDGTKKPVKRTALGRFKHESAAFKELDDGRVAVYMGDDQRGDYCYKYESNRPWRDAIADGESPLDDGKLYVAKFLEGGDDNDGKGLGEWIELTPSNPAIQNAGLTTMDQVLVYTRLAADAVGATPMDRPEWSSIGTNGEVFWTLTNNDRKDNNPPQGAVSEVNPIFENKDGHIISTLDTSATTFEWSLFILARNTRPTDPNTGEPQDFAYAAYTPPADGGANTFTDPDACYADPFGRLYIGTDGGQPEGLQDQLLVFDLNTGEYKRILSGVASDEITGITATPDHRTLFTNVQHAGNGDPTATNFPAPTDGVTIPRDATLVITPKHPGFPFGNDFDDFDDD